MVDGRPEIYVRSICEVINKPSDREGSSSSDKVFHRLQHKEYAYI